MLGFIDVPGHERFVHTMLAGAGGIDFALLVVAADDGIKPQTLEHLAILDLLGIKRGLVALTKADIVPPDRLAVVTSADQSRCCRYGAGRRRYPAGFVSERGGRRMSCRARLTAEAA